MPKLEIKIARIIYREEIIEISEEVAILYRQREQSELMQPHAKAILEAQLRELRDKEIVLPDGEYIYDSWLKED